MTSLLPPVRPIEFREGETGNIAPPADNHDDVFTPVLSRARWLDDHQIGARSPAQGSPDRREPVVRHPSRHGNPDDRRDGAVDQRQRSAERSDRSNSPRSDSTWSDASRSGAARSETARSETTRSETARSETGRSEAARSDTTRSKAAGSETARPDDQGSDASESDAATTEAAPSETSPSETAGAKSLELLAGTADSAASGEIGVAPSTNAVAEITEAAMDASPPADDSAQSIAGGPNDTDRAVAEAQPEAELPRPAAATESDPGDETDAPSSVDGDPSSISNEAPAVVAGEPFAALGERLAGRTAPEVASPLPASEAMPTDGAARGAAATDPAMEAQLGSEASAVAATTAPDLGDSATGSGPLSEADAQTDQAAAAATTSAGLPSSGPSLDPVAVAPILSETSPTGLAQPGNQSTAGAAIDAVSAAVGADQPAPRVEGTSAPTTPPATAPLADQEADELWAQVQRALHRVRTGPEGAELRLRLHPAELGELLVQVRAQGDQLSVRLVTSSTAAQQTLLADQQRLAAELAEAGFADGTVDIGQWGTGASGGDSRQDHDEQTSSDPSATRSAPTHSSTAGAERALIDPSQLGRRRAGLVDLTL